MRNSRIVFLWGYFLVSGCSLIVDPHRGVNESSGGDLDLGAGEGGGEGEGEVSHDGGVVAGDAGETADGAVDLGGQADSGATDVGTADVSAAADGGGVFDVGAVDAGVADAGEPLECVDDGDCLASETCSCDVGWRVCQIHVVQCTAGQCVVNETREECAFGCLENECVVPECLLAAECPFAQECVEHSCVYDDETFICRFICDSDNRAVVWTGIDDMETAMPCRDSRFEFSLAQLCATGDPLPRMRINMHSGVSYIGLAGATFECNNPNFVLFAENNPRYPAGTRLVEFSTPICP